MTKKTVLLILFVLLAVVVSFAQNVIILVDFEKSGLNKRKRKQVLKEVRGYFLPFDIKFTTDKAEFLKHPPKKSQLVIVTDSTKDVEWNKIGTSYKWAMGNDSLTYIFSEHADYNPGFIGRTMAHELGHAIAGLDHIYDGEPNIMGFGFFRKAAHWGKGMTWEGFYQDDFKQLTENIGIKLKRK